MSHTLLHETLGTKLIGIEVACVLQFRGIPYGSIPARFARPELVEEDLPRELDCTRFGPRCPQVQVDVGHLLRLPAQHTLCHEPEDEFACLNLDVVVPNGVSSFPVQGLPVLVWIHGGSQAMTFGSSASGVCDMTALVSDAQNNGTPIVCVSIQYRLNIFAFGDETSAKNLAVLDQALALKWVQKHIKGFGGDPTQVTLAGESAGAVYCHAHMINEAPAKHVILSSGSLHLSPPQPPERAAAMRNLVLSKLQGLGQYDLRSAPCDVLLEAISQAGIQSWFLQSDPLLENWKTKAGHTAKRLLLSDVQNEAVIWREGIWSTNTETIADAFNQAGPEGDKLKRVYNIEMTRPSSCKLGALDFINDYRFVLPIERLTEEWRAAQKPVYRCLVDEPNPWQPSNGAHHAVDLILLFGGFDYFIGKLAKRTGEEMRHRWIAFINGKDPWCSESYMAFGPHGTVKELDRDEYRSRRRIAQTDYLVKVDSGLLDKVFGALAAGKISLSN